MTQPQPQETSSVVTLERAWQHLMRTLAFTNLQRARDARKAAAYLTRERNRF